MKPAVIEAPDWIAYHAQAAPDREALHDLRSGRRFTYREMNERVDKVASLLSTQEGVQAGDRVAVLSHNDSDMFEIQFACGRLGAIFVPLNWRLAVPELEYIGKDARPRVLLHGPECTEAASQVAKRCGIARVLDMNCGKASRYEEAIARACDHVRPVRRKMEDTWTILYTSGTSGLPKGVLITCGMMHFNAVDCTMVGDLTARSRNLVMLPMFHTGGLNVWANPVFHVGGCNVVMRAFDPGWMLALLADPVLRITHTLGVPTNFLMMAQEPGFGQADLSHVECLCVGGAAASESLIRSYDAVGVRLRAMYGMTEIGPLGLALPPERRLEKIGSSGLPTMHTQMKVCNADGMPTQDGEVGELLIRGPSVTPGYWNKPAETAAAFDAQGWLHTGDAARCDRDGFFFIVDRWKDMYISGGENVYPAEVENAIYRLPGVLETAVIGIADEKWGEVGCAFVVLRQGTTLYAEQVMEHCRSHLAGYKVPRKVRIVAELPHNATGKILKQQLPRDPG